MIPFESIIIPRVDSLLDADIELEDGRGNGSPHAVEGSSLLLAEDNEQVVEDVDRIGERVEYEKPMVSDIEFRTPSLVYDARKVGHLPKQNVKRILKSTAVLFPRGKIP